MEYLWLIFALLSAFTASLVAIFGKVGLEGIDSNTATAIRAIIMALLLVGVIIVQGKLGQISEILSNSKALTFIVLSSIAGALSWLFFFFALKVGKVSQVAPIDKLSVVFAVVFALLFLGEKLSLRAGIGAALIAAGAILVAVG
ncbi:MAG: EamA family transporter [Candidatus Woesearchaeota archaeon]